MLMEKTTGCTVCHAHANNGEVEDPDADNGAHWCTSNTKSNRLTGVIRQARVKTRYSYRQTSPKKHRQKFKSREKQAKSWCRQGRTQKTLGNTRNSLENTLKKAVRKEHEDDHETGKERGKHTGRTC